MTSLIVNNWPQTNIMKTFPYNIQRIFFLPKIDFIGKKDIFLIFAQVHNELPGCGGSNEYPQSMFWSKNKKNGCTTGDILHGHVILMIMSPLT